MSDARHTGHKGHPRDERHPEATADVVTSSGAQDGLFDYEYAVIRVVPCVHLCSFMNIGVILHARTANFLDAIVRIDGQAVSRIGPHLDLMLLERFADAYVRVCRGGVDAGPVGVLPASGRFHWLTSPRSCVLQTSVVHPGRCRVPEEALEHLFEMYCHGVAETAHITKQRNV